VRRNAILRFSDAENIPTVGAHLEIISSKKFAWWGWWRKEKESPSLELLKKLQTEIKTHSPLQIGLVNRKGEESLYIAGCVDLRYAVDGSRISSPDPDLTPEYYRADAFPAWFKFESIRTVSKTEFVKACAVVPYLDPTLYEVFWKVDGDLSTVEVTPSESWTMQQKSAPGEAILHLSDLHFGDYHGFPTVSAQPGRGLDGKPLWDIISTRVRRDLGIQIGVVVISGDLISKGKGEFYAEVRDFLQHLLPALELDEDHCVIVPGNHDMWTLGSEHPTRDYAHERPYRDFLESFFKQDFRSLERVRRYRTPSGRDLILLELNSARIRSDQLKEYGYVAKHRYERLLAFVAESLKHEKESGSPLFFAVLHHHIVPVSSVDIPDEKRPVSLCLDAGELTDELQTFGIQFVLHGHQHAPFIGTVSRLPSQFNGGEYVPDPLYVIGCGSSGGKREVLPRNLESNTFGIYVPIDGKLQVTVEKYTDSAPPHQYRQLLLPIRAWTAPAFPVSPAPKAT
jgi:predicted MPP superfamily phosphohydrolase